MRRGEGRGRIRVCRGLNEISHEEEEKRKKRGRKEEEEEAMEEVYGR